MVQALKNNLKRIASTFAAGVLLFSQFAVVPSVGATVVTPQGKIEVNKKVDADGNGVYEGGNGTANGLGFRWSKDGETLDNMMGDDEAASVGAHTVNENTISGYTFTGWYYTTDTDYSCANPRGATLPVNVTVVSDQKVKVTLCNQADQKGTIKLIKNVVNDNGGTAGVNDFGLSIGGTSVTSGQVLTLSPGSYAINEAGLSGYAFVSITGTGCPAQLGGNVSLAKGQNVVCTITNDDAAAKLKLKKSVTNNNGGTAVASDFTLYANGQAKTQNQYFNANPGTYTITESGPSGYTQTGISCVNDANQQAVTHPVNLALGKSVTCTVSNDDNAPGLTVIKKVINDNGGTKVPGDFTMKVTGTNVSPSSFAGNLAGTSVSLNAGSYSVSENGPNGYVAYYSDDCTGTIALGQNKTCTVTNDDIPALLTVIKYVVNDDGGLLKPSDFYLYVGNTQVPSGTPYYFNAGSYTVGEINQPGYTAGSWQGDCDAYGNIKLKLGGEYTCSITNDDQPAKITVTKKVVNDNGGEAEAKDFTLKVNDTVVASGVANYFDGNDEYTISEADGPKGYEQTDLSCYEEGREVVDEISQNVVSSVLPNPFTAKPGRSYHCTVVNDDMAASLKIKKEANPQSDHDFEFESDQLGYFKLDNDGDNSNTLKDYKKFENLEPGVYSVREQETNDWYLESIVCDGTDKYWIDWQENKLFVKLKAGDEATCKFVNEKLNKIKGYKFEDVNFNGKWDDGEPTIEDWTIKLTKHCEHENEDEACEDEVSKAKTNVDGEFEFEELMPGEYTLCEEQDDDWIQTHPSGDGCYDLEIDGPGDVIKNKNFGNFKKGEVEGVKFNDINGNHKRDDNEPTLKNWEIKLTKLCEVNVEELARIAQVDECEDETWTTKTDANGAYSFEGLEPGDYVVCETQQANWTQTYPQTEDGCHEFTIDESDQAVTANFGNKAKPQVLGAQAPTLVVTGTTTGKSMLVGLSILSVLGALHILSVRRKDYAK